MDSSILTTVGRPIGLSYTTNRAIAVVSLVVMIGSALLQRLLGASWIQSALWAAVLGASLYWLYRTLSP
jgi:hypothetical protein